MYEVTRITNLQVTEVMQLESLDDLPSTEDANRKAAKDYKDAHNVDNVVANVKHFPREIAARSEEQNA